MPVLAIILFALTVAPDGTTEHYFTITFQEGRAVAGQGQKIEVQSFHWGPRQSTSADGFVRAKPHVAPGEAAKIDSFTVKQGVKPVASGGGANEMSMDDTGGKEAGSLPPELPVMSSTTESSVGQATGKRQHMPLRMRGYYDTSVPPPQGSLRVKVKMPWLGCEEGREYPSLTLSGGGKSHVLQEVQVADCGGTSEGPEESITFVYGKLVVRGWDPKKKESVTGQAEPR